MTKKIIYFLLVMSFFSSKAQKNKFSIANKAKWVSSIDYIATKQDSTQDNYGYYYHLIDHQTNIDKKSYFSHYSVELLNNEGVQQISDISIDFDPAYQKLIFHKINIIRDGSTIKKLSLKNIKTVQRETNMERFLYDGTLTAFVNLTDVRVGDIIDYSYTVIGANPVYENKFHSKAYFQYTIPIGLLHKRIIISKDRKLQFKYFNNAPKPKINNLNGINEYSWINKNLNPILYDVNTPSWYDPSPRISISEYNSWNEVSKQYSKHYTLSPSQRKILTKKASKLFNNTPKDSLVYKIRKFVQDEIRYLGFEGGLNSHKPDNPINVINQRYGDCKAKSFLLAELYKIYNIEAYPILVHSYNGLNIPDELPSPNLFNHCIVQLKFGKETYYIDPTMNNQGGFIENLYVPSYLQGLVLKEDENELSIIKSTSENTISIIEEIDLDSIGGGAKLNVTTTYSGYNADNQRINFAKKNITKIQKEYLNFYSAIYPNIKKGSRIKYIDNISNRNELIVKENYTIDSIWNKSDSNKHILNCEFYPLSLESYINPVKSPSRSMPYHVEYPIDIEHQIIVNLPEQWNIKQENTVVKGNSFVYSYDVNYRNKKLNLYHTYKTTKNYIAPKEAHSFVKKHEKILNELTYRITYNTNYNTVNNSNTDWKFILISFFIIILFIYFYIKNL